MSAFKRAVSITLLLCVVFSFCAPGRSAGGNTAYAADSTSSVDGENALQEGLNCFYALDGVTDDKEKARDCFLQASELGVPEAYYYLGLVSLRSSDDSRF